MQLITHVRVRGYNQPVDKGTIFTGEKIKNIDTRLNCEGMLTILAVIKNPATIPAVTHIGHWTPITEVVIIHTDKKTIIITATVYINFTENIDRVDAFGNDKRVIQSIFGCWAGDRTCFYIETIFIVINGCFPGIIGE